MTRPTRPDRWLLAVVAAAVVLLWLAWAAGMPPLFNDEQGRLPADCEVVDAGTMVDVGEIVHVVCPNHDVWMTRDALEATWQFD